MVTGKGRWADGIRGRGRWAPRAGRLSGASPQTIRYAASLPPAWRNWQRTCLVNRGLGVQVPSSAPSFPQLRVPTRSRRSAIPSQGTGMARLTEDQKWLLNFRLVFVVWVSAFGQVAFGLVEVRDSTLPPLPTSRTPDGRALRYRDDHPCLSNFAERRPADRRWFGDLWRYLTGSGWSWCSFSPHSIPCHPPTSPEAGC